MVGTDLELRVGRGIGIGAGVGVRVGVIRRGAGYRVTRGRFRNRVGHDMGWGRWLGLLHKPWRGVVARCWMRG